VVRVALVSISTAPVENCEPLTSPLMTCWKPLEEVNASPRVLGCLGLGLGGGLVAVDAERVAVDGLQRGVLLEDRLDVGLEAVVLVALVGPGPGLVGDEGLLVLDEDAALVLELLDRGHGEEPLPGVERDGVCGATRRTRAGPRSQ
jgi:hypothetical protein